MLTPEQKEKLRDRCKRDLFFLGREILHYDFEEEPHRAMCSFFVQKNPDLSLQEQDSIKERQLLAPRGSFKSTVNVVDAVQWIITFPNIRILIITAEKSLAEAFASELKNHFVIRDEPTDFQILFPEFCVTAPIKEPFAEFTTPARTRFYKEPTFWVNSIGSDLPGWHCDVMKLDDVINDKNASNEIQIQKTINSVNMARQLVDPGGYIDVIGTPYAPTDYYLYQREHAAPDKFKSAMWPAWTPIGDGVTKPEAARGPEDYKLLFPKRLTYEFLKDKFAYDPITFRTQYLVDARGAGSIFFSDELLDSAIIPWASISSFSQHYAIWDLAYTETGNCTAGGVFAVDPVGRLILISLIVGKFSPSEVANEIVKPMNQYMLVYTGIEDSAGVRWLEPQIRQAAAIYGIEPNIYWIPIDRTKNAKYRRISLVPDLMRQKRLLISDQCDNLLELRTHLLNYTGKRGSPDDVPDMLGIAAETLGNYVPPLSPEQREDAYNKAIEIIQERALQELLYPVPPPVVDPVTPSEDAGLVNYFD